MPNRNPGLSENTEQVLAWAARAQERNDTVRELWEALCDRFDVGTKATGEGVLLLLRKAGSPDGADIFRDKPARYPEVCRYVAEKLRPGCDDAGCMEEDVLSCEKYVLKRMKISEDDLETLCSSIRDRRKSQADEAGAVETLTIATVEGIAITTARVAREKAVEKATYDAYKKVATEVKHQVVKLVLAEVLIAVDIAVAELTLIGIKVPAYHKAIPGVVYVALLRKLHAAESALPVSAANKLLKRTPKHPGWQGSAGRAVRPAH